LPHEKKLILALNHPIHQNRLLAIQLLGNLRSTAALPYFKAALAVEDNTYLLRDVLTALAKIGSPESREVLSGATKHASHLVREFAARLMIRRAVKSERRGVRNRSTIGCSASSEIMLRDSGPHSVPCRAIPRRTGGR